MKISVIEEMKEKIWRKSMKIIEENEEKYQRRRAKNIMKKKKN